MTTVEAAVRQYGGYIQMSDLLLLTAIDNNLTMATKLLGAQAGRTLDTITREVLGRAATTCSMPTSPCPRATCCRAATPAPPTTTT